MNTEKIIQVVIGLSMFALVIFLLWFMFGHSPTLEQILILFVIPLTGVIFGMYERLNNKIISTKVQLFKEVGEIKQAIGRIEGKINK